MPHTRRVLVATAALTLLLAACVDSSIKPAADSTPGPIATAPQGPTTTAAGASRNTQGALGSPGGKGGAASGAPFTIGYANQEQLFPEATIGLDAAVKFANAELGGVGGHRIVVQKCNITVEEDGQSCGTQFANNPNVKAVLTGTLLSGGAG